MTYNVSSWMLNPTTCMPMPVPCNSVWHLEYAVRKGRHIASREECGVGEYIGLMVAAYSVVDCARFTK